MQRINATAPTYLKNRRRGILPRPQRVHCNCTPFLHEPRVYLLVEWDDLIIDDNGFVPLAIAKFNL